MKFCSKCGKEVDEAARFCSDCGNLLAVPCNSDNTREESAYVDSSIELKTNLASNTIKGIGVALTIIGLVSGILIAIFMSSSGESFGYDSWNYYYGGGRETSIGIAVFSGASLLIGLCMLVGSIYSNKKQ